MFFVATTAQPATKPSSQMTQTAMMIQANTTVAPMQQSSTTQSSTATMTARMDSSLSALSTQPSTVKNRTVLALTTSKPSSTQGSTVGPSHIVMVSITDTVVPRHNLTTLPSSIVSPVQLATGLNGIFVLPCGCSPRGLYHVSSCSLPYCCVKWILSSILITFWGTGLRLVYCL